MARIIYSLNATLGGTCFHEDVIADEEHHRYAIDLLHSAEALLLGRNTYDLFVEFWPSAVHRNDLPCYIVELATLLSEIPKIVVSNRELDPSWKNTKRIPGMELTVLRSALRAFSGNVVLFGSPGLAKSLAAEKLINEVHILLQPLFSERGPQTPFLWHEYRMRNLSASRFTSGVICLCYQLAP
ncbi:dihydrofolate reductase family protein [Cellvibrio polysaccharolyticus]|uniref:Bacterial bifunctional deaminase-reductase C-terminal domain-containing protein n=1 Tax=Cellvibrio polysaccharolyticus TaxID=2082724 RepID=A0A928UZ93_9GAMM|nr:dihydrofolate reductase family protein [Cellvibrio polysaccharolyticus]MBE8715960.1 hypothetical protein [Cellvibrio polysaccharolyticus]